jgi:hypothetical protein
MQLVFSREKAKDRNQRNQRGRVTFFYTRDE